MYHTIEFTDDILLDVATSARHRLERMLVRRGTRLPAQLKPYVVQTAAGLVEMADLFFDDGTSTSGVRFDQFRFVEES